MKQMEEFIGKEYLRVIKEDFNKYKNMGDKTFAQLDEHEFYFKLDEESNSIAVIIRHLSGNMISRFTDFLTSDGEKPDRHRDKEFEEINLSKDALLEAWEKGWNTFLSTLKNIKEEDLTKQVKIRNEPHSVIEALNRQATHYSYHIGQIVLIAKHLKKENWKTLSIPKNKSEEFNKKKLSENS